jgi:hypothetical protein
MLSMRFRIFWEAAEAEKFTNTLILLVSASGFEPETL